MEVMEGINNGFDNTNVMLWKLGPEDRNIGEYIAVRDYSYVHEVDPDMLAVKRKMGLDVVTDGISASADGGPRSRVCARETLRSAPHRH